MCQEAVTAEYLTAGTTYSLSSLCLWIFPSIVDKILSTSCSSSCIGLILVWTDATVDPLLLSLLVDGTASSTGKKTIIRN